MKSPHLSFVYPPQVTEGRQFLVDLLYPSAKERPTKGRDGCWQFKTSAAAAAATSSAASGAAAVAAPAEERPSFARILEASLRKEDEPTRAWFDDALQYQVHVAPPSFIVIFIFNFVGVVRNNVTRLILLPCCLPSIPPSLAPTDHPAEPVPHVPPAGPRHQRRAPRRGQPLLVATLRALSCLRNCHLFFIYLHLYSRRGGVRVRVCSSAGGGPLR
jgi:hypothetical protein